MHLHLLDSDTPQVITISRLLETAPTILSIVILTRERQHTLQLRTISIIEL